MLKSSSFQASQNAKHILENLGAGDAWTDGSSQLDGRSNVDRTRQTKARVHRASNIVALDDESILAVFHKLKANFRAARSAVVVVVRITNVVRDNYDQWNHHHLHTFTDDSDNKGDQSPGS